MALKFPSVDFFRELARRMNGDRATFEKLGFCDAVMGVRVLGKAPHLYALTFEVYDCTEVRELASLGGASSTSPCSVRGAVERDARVIQKGADSRRRPYTLNSLSHVGDRMKVVYDDPEGHDKLYRFMATIQASSTPPAISRSNGSSSQPHRPPGGASR